MDVEPYSYAIEPAPPSSCEDLLLPELDAQGNSLSGASKNPREAGHAETELRLAEARRSGFETGLQQGRTERRIAEHDAQHASRSEEARHRAEQLTRLFDQFAGERDRYFERIEHEVVKLSLAVAARILRREAQTDPLLLLGAVRVALGQLAAATQLRLKVPRADASLWTEAVALLPGRAFRPEIVAHEDLRLGECLLETDLGSVDLGVRAQLGEIERDFFDRATPVAVPASTAAVQS